MGQVEGDFYDLLVYFSNLFAHKKIKEIQIEPYVVEYDGYYPVAASAEMDQNFLSSFPSKDDVDRIGALRLSVRNLIAESSVSVTLGWESITYDPEVDRKLIERMIDVFDRSTFRYF
ncbi:MAG: hypothetical protein QXV22_05175 [Thermoplasmataceae archaeon]